VALPAALLHEHLFAVLGGRGSRVERRGDDESRRGGNCKLTHDGLSAVA